MHLSIIAAFVAGLVSFLSPCVFPLVPGYLSYMAGTTAREAREARAESGARWRVTAHALFFVLGFALIFIVLGAAASTLGALLRSHQLLLKRGSGVLLILFGVTLTGLMPLPFLQQERRVHVKQSEPALLHSALIGMAFSAGWSPCIGTMLGSILLLAGVGSTLAQGVLFLLVYALGLGMPFLLVGLLIDRAGPFMRRVNRYTGPISIAGGAVLALTGLLVLSGRLDQLAQYTPLINL